MPQAKPSSNVSVPRLAPMAECQDHNFLAVVAIEGHIRPAAELDHPHVAAVAAQRSFALFSATRAFTIFFTSDTGSGLSCGN